MRCRKSKISARRKGQAAVEFALSLSILLTVFSVFMIIISQKTADQAENNFRNTLELFTDYARSEVDVALYVEDGYVRNFTLPPALSGAEYTMTTRHEPGRTLLTVAFDATDIEHTMNFEADIIGSFQKENNQINKTGGVIYLN